MYSIEDIKHGLNHPSSALYELYRVLGISGVNGGTHVFDEDWDTLVILDACRYDAFKKVVAPAFEGTLGQRQSRGSATKQWVSENFRNRDLHDTVYVSANGWYDRLRPELNASLHDAVWLYTDDYRNEMGTVPPEDVTETALEVAEQYPEKRLVVHYVQPHKPYLGSTAEEYFSHARNISMQEMVARSHGGDAELREAYYETLERTIPEVRRLVDNIRGKTVISSDHGEALGERHRHLPLKNYGHPVDIEIDELVTVPWFELPFDTRRKIVSEPPTESDCRDTEQLEEHLRAMGYK